MNTQSRNEYLLIFRGNVWDKDLSPEELQKVVTQWASWFEGLIQQGKCKTGQPLEREGKIVSGKKRTVADGPFAESKEAVGGYFLLQVDTIDEAVAIAKQCPGLDYGIDVEVRPVAEQCTGRTRLESMTRGEHLAAV